MKRPNSHACDAWQLLVRFSFSQKCQVGPLAAELELSPAQCHVLRLLDPERAIPMRQVAEGLGCDASNVTGLVDRLEERGIVERRPAPADRRVKVVQLTPTGSRLRAQLLRRMTARGLPLSRLDAREHRALVKILERLLADETQRR
jgi:DNA-binding MarR family transcriptional regulator